MVSAGQKRGEGAGSGFLVVYKMYIFLSFLFFFIASFVVFLFHLLLAVVVIDDISIVVL